MHFYGWKKGLKTGMYYLRTRPAAQAIQFTVDQSVLNDAKKQQAAGRVNVDNGVVTPSPSPSPVDRVKVKSITPNVPSSPNMPEPVLPKAKAVSGPAPGSEPPASPTHSHFASPTPQPTSNEEPAEPLSLDETTAKAAAEDPEFAAALQRQRDRELAEAKLMCSLENKEACLMCSG